MSVVLKNEKFKYKILVFTICNFVKLGSEYILNLTVKYFLYLIFYMIILSIMWECENPVMASQDIIETSFLFMVDMFF